MNDVNVRVTEEDRRGLRDARHVLGKLAEAGLEVDEHGVPQISLIVDDLDCLLSKIEDEHDPHSRAVRPAFGVRRAGHVRVLR